MIVTKTPLRVGFFGGGTDLPQYYNSGKEGVCVSATIDSYIYIAANRCTTPHLRIIYSEMELADNIEKIRHDRVREALKYFSITNNIEICSFSDFSTKGTGLGSSSTFTVGLVNALSHLYSSEELSRWNLADIACHIEIDKCKEPIGKQDQYAAAYGGLNEYTFTDTDVYIEPIQATKQTLNALCRQLFFIDTKIPRSAGKVLSTQAEKLTNDQATIDKTQKMVDLAKYSVKLLIDNKVNDFGALLDEAWKIKRGLTEYVTNDTIDEIYDRIKKAGALGGKILGAGGGGYFLAYIPAYKIRDALEQLKDYDIKQFNFTKQGSSVELHDNESNIL